MDGDGNSYRYVFEEDGFSAAAADYQTWATRIKEHALGNGLPVPDMAVAEDQLCGRIPPDRCLYETGDPQPIDISFTVSDVGNWIKAIASKIALGSQFVSQAEAERRAGICVRCPLNITAQGCSGCAKVASMLTPGMAAKHTSQDEKLKNCGICKCYNRIQVWFPLEVLRESGSGNLAYPSYCWKA